MGLQCHQSPCFSWGFHSSTSTCWSLQDMPVLHSSCLPIPDTNPYRIALLVQRNAQSASLAPGHRGA